MAYLTLGELTGGGLPLGDPVRAGEQRLLTIRQRPGYGPNMLSQYASILPAQVMAAEKRRLQEQQALAASGDPVTYALLQLRRAYEQDDIRSIRRWQTAVTNAGGRGYLRAVKDRNKSYRQRGLMGLG